MNNYPDPLKDFREVDYETRKRCVEPKDCSIVLVEAHDGNMNLVFWTSRNGNKWYVPRNYVFAEDR
jgi:hypothetical protein